MHSQQNLSYLRVQTALLLYRGSISTLFPRSVKTEENTLSLNLLFQTHLLTENIMSSKTVKVGDSKQGGNPCYLRTNGVPLTAEGHVIHLELGVGDGEALYFLFSSARLLIFEK